MFKQIRDSVSIVDYAAYLGYTPQKKGGRYYNLAEHDSLMIDAQKNTFKRYSADDVYGDVIDFAVEMQNIDKGEAIKQLKAFAGITSQRDLPPPQKPAKPVAEEEPTPFELPEKFKGKYKRLFGYLCGERKLSLSVVQDMIRRKMLYESDGRHNAVFVGYDYDGKAKYAFQKGTSSNMKFALDVPGSKKYPVAIFVDNGSRSLVVSEAIIDAMSVMTITEKNGGNYKAHSYLSMQGNNAEAVKYHLQHNPKIEQVVMAVDNDRTGDIYRQKISKIVEDSGRNIKIYDRRPKNKDFNEDLKLEEYLKRPAQTESAETSKGDMTYE